jgi:hypothetical protein
MGYHLKFLKFNFTFFLLILALTELGTALSAVTQQENTGNVVINEIHYDPDLRTELVEFVELYNPGSTDIDLSGWYFNDGITYQFPTGAVLPAGGYIIVAQNPTDIRNKWTNINPDLIFGPFEGKLDNNGEKIELCNAIGEEIDQVDYKLGFPWPTVGDAVPEDRPGTGYSIQLINPSIDNDLAGSWRSASPTPALRNQYVYLENSPPHIRQVGHSPKQPKSGQTVIITAKVTDSDGISEVRLKYQIVNPGNYIPITLPNYPSTNPATKPNPAYETAWITLTMHDDGLSGDEQANDDVYSVTMPTNLQVHRRLIRYRIVIEDNVGYGLTVPYPDDPQPNFAYFVYDGVPAWSAAINPQGPWPDNQIVTYGTELMQSLPVYHLLSRAIDVQNCQYNPGYDDHYNPQYYFSGTLVYDGEVYDHIRYRIRGQWSPFQTGKEKWKIDFKRGHYFQARDDYGNKYKNKWDKMNIGSGTCPWWQYPHPGGWDVGTRGMMLNEALAFRLYNMAGVPSCNTNFFHFRVIDNSVEASPSSQYEGDFWGLYLAIEQPDGAFLDEHGMPDGNIYRMEGDADKTHQGETQVSNNTDVTTFINTYNSHPSSNWWSQKVNMSNYYSSRAIGIAINDSDRRPEYNCIYYHNSQTGQWLMLPWDLDLTYEWATHYSDWEHFRYALSYSEYNIASKNRARELLDLLLNNDQAWKVIDEIAAIISTPYDGKTFVEANRALWDQHPRTVKKGQFYENNEFLNTKDWAGMIEYYKTFLTPTGFSDVTSGSYGVYALEAEASDHAIAYTPTITYTGPGGFPSDNLTFQTSSFRDPQGNSTFAAIKWRVAETDSSNDNQGKYEINAVWESDEITSSSTRTVTIPIGIIIPGHVYRVRCRMKDNTGRWSHWSEPVQFEAGEPLSAGMVNNLRITELMYNPAKADTTRGELAVNNEDFEFIELKNIGFETIDLNQVKFTDGIDFTFPNFELSPDEYVIIVKDEAAFESRYGSMVNIVGEYSGRLDNSGERIHLVNAFGRTIFEFSYNNNWYDTTDGQGYSLTIVDPANSDTNSWNQKDSWRSSMYVGGSPGQDDL